MNVCVTPDPNNFDVYYSIDSGFGATEWSGPYPSSSVVSLTHSWYNEGNYEIRVKAKNIHGDESV